MTTTEEIIVSGDNYIERVVTVFPERDEIAAIRQSVCKQAYKRGWFHGFLLGAAFAGLVAWFVWLVLLQ